MKKNWIPLISLVAGIGLIFYAISDGGTLGAFIDIPSLIITLLGTLAALFISYPFAAIRKLPRLLVIMLNESTINKSELIELFVELSRKSRSKGILALEQDIPEIENELMQQGLQLVVDGMDPEDIRDILEIKLANVESRHGVGQSMFNKMGELAPAFGMIGTLIGLINMLGQLNDPSMIGSGMATALITTFYGSFFSNLVFLPIATNLKDKTQKEMQLGEMIIEGVLSVQAGQNPRVIEQKLLSYLPAGSLPAEEEGRRAASPLNGEV